MRSLYLSSSDAAGLTLQHTDGSAVPLDEAEAWDRDAANGNGSVVLLQFTQPRGALLGLKRFSKETLGVCCCSTRSRAVPLPTRAAFEVLMSRSR